MFTLLSATAPFLAAGTLVPLLTKKELADLLNVSTRTIDRMLAAKAKLGRVQVGGQPRFDPRRIKLPGLMPLTAPPEPGSVAAGSALSPN